MARVAILGAGLGGVAGRRPGKTRIELAEPFADPNLRWLPQSVLKTTGIEALKQ